MLTGLEATELLEGSELRLKKEKNPDTFLRNQFELGITFKKLNYEPGAPPSSRWLSKLINIASQCCVT